MTMKGWLGAAVAVVLASLSASAQQAPEVNPLLGMWRLVSLTRVAIPSGERSSPFGPDPAGYMTYAPGGRMMAVIVRGDRQAPRSAVATDAESAALFRSMIAFSGTYQLVTEDGNLRAVQEIDVSWNEAWSRTREVRFVALDGKHLRLTTRPSKDPIDGVYSIRELQWERVDP